MVWAIDDRNSVIQEIKALGAEALDAWDLIEPVLIDMPYPVNQNLHIYHLDDGNYAVWLPGTNVRVAYRINAARNILLLGVQSMEDEP